MTRPERRLSVAAGAWVLALAILSSAAASAQTVTKVDELQGARVLAAGSDGAIWFGEGTRDLIGRITPDGQVIRVATGHGGVNELTAGPDGAMWFIASGALGRITSDGSLSYPPAPLASNRSALLAGLDGNLWYIEFAYGSNQTRLVRRTLAGDTSGFDAVDQLNRAVVGFGGNLWFSRFLGSLVRADALGQTTEFPLTDFGSYPYPDGLAAGPDGSVWYALKNRMAVGRITAGGVVQQYPVPLQPTGAIARGADGYMWFGVTDGLFRFDSSGVGRHFELDQLPGSSISQIVVAPDGKLRLVVSPGGFVVSSVWIFEPPAEVSPVQYLGGARYEVRVTWSASGYGSDVPAPTRLLTGDTGSVYFFSPGNLELVVKVVDGTAFNGKHWVFVGGLTDVAYTLTIRDILTGAVRTYSRPQGQMASYADTAAFGP